MTDKHRYQMPPKTDHCELCGRTLETLTKHHLIPRSRHRKKRNQRLFSREQVITHILWVCRPCHNDIHNMLSEKELEARYHTRQALLAHPDMQRFVAWISRRPAALQ